MYKNIGRVRIWGHNSNNNNTQFVERRGAIASEALADRSSQLARNRREKMNVKV